MPSSPRLRRKTRGSLVLIDLDDVVEGGVHPLWTDDFLDAPWMDGDPMWEWPEGNLKPGRTNNGGGWSVGVVVR